MLALQFWLTFLNVDGDISTITVQDIIIPNRTWNREELYKFFAVGCIESIPIAVHAEKDHLVWCDGRGPKVKLSDMNALWPIAAPSENAGKSFKWDLEIGDVLRCFGGNWFLKSYLLNNCCAIGILSIRIRFSVICAPRLLRTVAMLCYNASMP